MSPPVPAAVVRSTCVCSGARERGLGLLKRDLIGLRIDPKQQVAALHAAAIVDEHLDHLPFTCGLTETMSWRICASSVDTLPPLVSQ